MISKLPSKEKKRMMKYLEERFNIKKELFKDYALYINQNKRVFIGPKSIVREPVATGLQIARIENTIKPSTNFFHMFGDKIKKNVIDIKRSQVKDFVAGEDIPLNKTDTEEGYVLVKYEKKSLGCGLLKNNLLRSMIPKSKRVPLENF